MWLLVQRNAIQMNDYACFGRIKSPHVFITRLEIHWQMPRAGLSPFPPSFNHLHKLTTLANLSTFKFQSETTTTTTTPLWFILLAIAFLAFRMLQLCRRGPVSLPLFLPLIFRANFSDSTVCAVWKSFTILFIWLTWLQSSCNFFVNFLSSFAIGNHKCSDNTKPVIDKKMMKIFDFSLNWKCIKPLTVTASHCDVKQKPTALKMDAFDSKLWWAVSLQSNWPSAFFFPMCDHFRDSSYIKHHPRAC